MCGVFFLRKQVSISTVFPNSILVIFPVLFLFEFIAQKWWQIGMTEVSYLSANLKGKSIRPSIGTVPPDYNRCEGGKKIWSVRPS